MHLNCKSKRGIALQIGPFLPRAEALFLSPGDLDMIMWGSFGPKGRPCARAQLPRKLLLSLDVPELNIYCGRRKFWKMLTTFPRIYYSEEHEILTDEI